MRLSKNFLRGECLFCGLEIGQGGMWSTAKGDIALCGDPDCIDKLMHFAVDALKDGHLMGVSKRQLTICMKGVITDVIERKDKSDKYGY
ncbi:hypothetical protein [Paenisporosarcina sp. NPDC076898]|uniref:hypothetical protein n=1 Tax=unclassified Paenisporosarcina TaxID=2642018 RepID=UPI003D07D479